MSRFFSLLLARAPAFFEVKKMTTDDYIWFVPCPYLKLNKSIFIIGVQWNIASFYFRRLLLRVETWSFLEILGGGHNSTSCG
jgi:hypothetical protein